MANLQATKMQNWRVRSNGLYKNEFSQMLYGAMDFFVYSNSRPGAIVSPELLNRALGSTGNTIQVPVLKTNTSAEVGSSRVCAGVNNDLDSALVGLSWTTISDGFVNVPNRFMNNDIAEQQYFDAAMRAVCLRMATKIDQLALAALGTDKTALMNSTLNYTFSSSTLKAKWNDRFDLIGDLNSMMIANGFYDRLNIVGNMGMLNIFNKLAEHDTYNAVNKRYEYADKNLWLTHQLANPSTSPATYATFYCVPEGQVAILLRVARPEYRGSSSGEHVWGTTELPLMNGITVGTHYFETQGDMTSYTSESDMTCDYAEHYNFAVDVAFLTAYNSQAASKPSPIVYGTVETGDNGVTNVKVVAPIPES